MEAIFENLISRFLEDKVGVSDTFLSEELATDLRKNLLSLFSEQQFKKAGIGSSANRTTNDQIRTDQIYWLDRAHNNVHENRFFDYMDAFIAYLNRTCYTGIVDYEFHYALYDKGTFYKRHIDQFKDNKDRAFSMIMYLNENWQAGDGGQLCVYKDNQQQIINPTNRKCVFFKSDELEHEVLLSHQPRLSVTGWLKTG